MAVISNSTPVSGVSNILTHPREQLRQLRERMAQAVETLIAAIDAIDGDPDLEPSLGSVGAASPHWLATPAWSQGNSDDREDECEGEGAQCDDEGHDSDTELNGDELDFQSGCPDEPPSYDVGFSAARLRRNVLPMGPNVVA